VATLVLALPSAALAQSAGDDQYQDPFAGQEQPQGGGGNSGGGNSGGGAGGGGQGDNAQASPSQTASGDGSQGQTAQAGDTLPRTGMPAFLLLAYGWALLVGGVALRRAGRAGR
jgi:hypothetical protein